jgi:hypothetical protein
MIFFAASCRAKLHEQANIDGIAVSPGNDMTIRHGSSSQHTLPHVSCAMVGAQGKALEFYPVY